MKNLSQYVPQTGGQETEPFTIVCGGDQLSCERMAQSRRSMNDHHLPKDTIKGLEPCNQEFHFRCLALQVKHNCFYLTNSGFKLSLIFFMILCKKCSNFSVACLMRSGHHQQAV